MKRILFLSPRKAFPYNSGAKLREYCFLKALGERFEVHYVCYRMADEGPLEAADLPFCKTVQAVEKPKPYTVGKTLQGILGRWPLPVVNYSSEAMLRASAAVADSVKPDAVHLEHLNLAGIHAALQTHLPKKLATVYNWHNIDSEVMLRYTTAGNGMLRSQYARYTAARLRALEAEILREGRGHFVCSGRERDLIRDLAPDARVEVIENGIDCSQYEGMAALQLSEPPHSFRILFVGTMDYHPNVDGAGWFVKEAWPQIRAEIPQAELQIVGARPTPAVTALAKNPGVIVTGTVPDVRQYYQGAFASVVPLRTGGGTRLKILESMAAGVPVISTALGAEGLQVVDGSHYLLASTEAPVSWLDALQRLNTSPSSRTQLARVAYDLVRQRYDWQVLGDRLVDVYRQWLEIPS